MNSSQFSEKVPWLVFIPPADRVHMEDALFGRSQELGDFVRAVCSRPVLVLQGDPGVGKTRLAVHSIRAIQESLRGPNVLWIRLRTDSEFEELAVAILASSEGTRLPSFSSPTSLAQAVFEALHSGNYTLMIDNFESVMDPMRETVTDAGYSHLLELISNHSIGASRVVLVSWWLPRDEKGRTPYCWRLNGLGSAGVSELLQDHGVMPEPELVESMFRLTGGNPLAIEAFVGQLSLGRQPTAETLEAPVPIRSAVGRLTPTELSILRAVAICRVEASERMLRDLVAADNDISKELDRLTNSKNILETRWEGERFYSAHMMYVITARNGMEENEKRRLHRAAMDFYWERADRDDYASEDWVDVLFHGMQSGEFRVLAGLIVNENFGESLLKLGRFSLLRKTLEAILDLRSDLRHVPPRPTFRTARKHQTIDFVGELLYLLAQTTWRTGELSHASACLAFLHSEFPTDAKYAAAWAGIQLERGENRLGLQSAQSAIKLARAHKNRRAEMEALGWRGYALDDSGPFHDCLCAYRDSLQIAQEIGDRHSIALIHARVGMVLWKVGKIKEAALHFREAHKHALVTEDPYLIGMTEGDMGHAYADLPDVSPADLVKARKWYEKAYETHRLAGVRRGQAFWLGQIGRVSAMQGDRGSALIYLDKAVALHREVGDLGALPRHLWYLGDIIAAIPRERELGLAYYYAAVRRFEQVRGLLELNQARERFFQREGHAVEEFFSDSVVAGAEAIELYLASGQGTLPLPLSVSE